MAVAITSVEVSPCRDAAKDVPRYGFAPDETMIQACGLGDAEFFGVYTRDAAGMAESVEDFPEQPDAMDYGEKLAKRLGVPFSGLREF